MSSFLGPPFQAFHVTQAIQLAGRFSASFAPERDPKKGFSILKGLSQQVASSDALCDLLEARMLSIRQRVFGSDCVPFRSDSAAARWIEETSRNENSAQLANPDRAKVEELVGKVRDLAGSDDEVLLKKRYLVYLKPRSEWVHRVRARSGGKLYVLARECESISTYSGFRDVAVLWWLLRGVAPVLSCVTVTRVTSTTAAPQTIITVNGPDLTWRQAWAVFSQLSGSRGQGMRAAGPRRMRIIQMVRARGGIPKAHGAKKAFWESIRVQLTKEFGGKTPVTWQAIRKNYLSTLPKIR